MLKNSDSLKDPNPGSIGSKSLKETNIINEIQILTPFYTAKPGSVVFCSTT